jgi:hypothetical protein
MADVRAAWNETGDKLSELGRKLKVHYDSQHGGESEQAREELTDAARKLGSAVQDAFEAIGTAARDRAVKEDVKQVGQSLAEALGATLGQAADELRRAFSERKGTAAGTTAAPGTTEAEAGAAEPVVEAGAKPPTGDGEEPPKVEPWGTP